MPTIPFSVYLPYTDGTKGVFCENSYRRRRPCDGRLTYDADGNLVHGYVLYVGSREKPVGFCTAKCLEYFASH
jgi:hypothetical protein